MISKKFCVWCRTIPSPFTPESPVTVRAYAKINLGLRILRKRPDGYHDIETVFHRIDLFDELSLSPAAEIEVISDSEAAPGDEKNLCHRAARMLRERAGVRHGVSIRLAKRIPVGAGCGGGSSDAAAVLRTLPRLWGVGITGESLLSVAAELGSDVPYFLADGSAAASGRGEILDYFTLDLPFAILLCNPGIPVSTAWAYGEIIPRSDPTRPPLREIIAGGIAEPSRLQEELVNDFEGPVFRQHPAIRTIKEEMIANGAAYASLSGSGSSVFGFFRQLPAARALSEKFQSAGYRTAVTPPHFQPPP